MVEGILHQMSLFDLMDAETIATPEVMFTHVVRTADSLTEQEKLSKYLYKGERIVSLLREKKSGTMRYLPCDFLNKFNTSAYLEKKGVGMESNYVMQTAVRKTRELWEKNDSADVATNELLSYLSKYLYINAEVADSSKQDLAALMDCTFVKSEVRPKGIVSVKSVYRSKDYEIPAGEKSVLPKSKHLREWRLRSSKAGYYLLADAGKLFWKALLVCTLKEQVQVAIQELSEEELADNILYRYLCDKEESVIDIYRRMKEHQESSGVSQEGPVISVSSAYAEKPFVKKVMERYPDMNYEVMESERGVSAVNLDFFIASWFLSADEKDILPFEFLSGLAMSQLCELLEKVCDIYTTEKQTYEIANDLKKESAKVYQTKKNISLKCQRAMISSGFNKYFGYVEIDDECDLGRFDVIENQFKALSNHLFNGRKNGEVSIRFRKLGRHHAAGLYYPSIKCLAVDVRNTDSLSHEYFHMLDYENGNVSAGYAFSKVRDRYKTCLLEILNKPENKELSARLNKKTKYNLEYYLTPTEVFARCGELYLTKIKEVNNSLVKPDEQAEFAYPEDAVLLELIKNYFDEFLKTI